MGRSPWATKFEELAGRIGEAVMEALMGVDKIAYVRFASVYKDFREVDDFQALIGSLGGGDPGQAKDG